MAEIYDKTTSTWTEETTGIDIDNDSAGFGDSSAATMKRAKLKWWVGSVLIALRAAFTPASSASAASLAFHEDTDNGTNKITVTAPAAIASDKMLTLPDETGTVATRAYADALVAGLSWKQAVRVATTATGTLATAFENGDTVDGVTLATGDRILLKNQSSATENGIYVVAASGAPARASDADSGAELVNASVYVQEGTTNADKQFVCTTNAPITIGATNITFAEFSSGGGVTNSAGNNVIPKSDGTNIVASSFSNASTDVMTGSGSTSLTLSSGSGAILAYDSNNNIFAGASNTWLKSNGGSLFFKWDGSANNELYSDFGVHLGKVANPFLNAYISKFIEGAEMTAPAAPGGNGYRMFAEDNGSGKTRLMVIFATGAAQQLAIQP